MHWPVLAGQCLQSLGRLRWQRLCARAWPRTWCRDPLGWCDPSAVCFWQGPPGRSCGLAGESLQSVGRMRRQLLRVQAWLRAWCCDPSGWYDPSAACCRCGPLDRWRSLVAASAWCRCGRARCVGHCRPVSISSRSDGCRGQGCALGLGRVPGATIRWAGANHRRRAAGAVQLVAVMGGAGLRRRGCTCCAGRCRPMSLSSRWTVCGAMAARSGQATYLPLRSAGLV
jgi:hypothetical protein